MTFRPYPAMPFAPGVNHLVAATVNEYATRWVDMLDGAAGGTVAPTTPIEIKRAGLELAGTDRVTLGSRQITRHQDMKGRTISANWLYRPGNVWRNSVSGGTMVFEIEDIPEDGTLDTVTLRWDGASGHSNDPVDGGGTPIVMPGIGVFRVDEDGVATSLGSQTDTTTARAAYEAAHDISVTAIAHTIDRDTYRYIVTLTGETGAGFVANAEALSLTATCTVTEMPEF